MGVVESYYVERDSTSRYCDLARLKFSEGDECIETSDRITFKKSNKDRMFTVDLGFENRLDLISYEVYGSALYWWAIAMASNIVDPFDVPVGTVLTIPPLDKVRGR